MTTTIPLEERWSEQFLDLLAEFYALDDQFGFHPDEIDFAEQTSRIAHASEDELRSLLEAERAQYDRADRLRMSFVFTSPSNGRLPKLYPIQRHDGGINWDGLGRPRWARGGAWGPGFWIAAASGDRDGVPWLIELMARGGDLLASQEETIRPHLPEHLADVVWARDIDPVLRWF